MKAGRDDGDIADDTSCAPTGETGVSVRSKRTADRKKGVRKDDQLQAKCAQ